MPVSSNNPTHLCAMIATHAIIFFLTAGLWTASLLLPLDKTLIQVAHKERGVISLLHRLVDVTLDLVKDICAFVPYQCLLDLLIQSFLYWDFTTLYKEVLVDFTYQLWHLILYWEERKKKEKKHKIWFRNDLNGQWLHALTLGRVWMPVKTFRTNQICPIWLL